MSPALHVKNAGHEDAAPLGSRGLDVVVHLVEPAVLVGQPGLPLAALAGVAFLAGWAIFGRRTPPPPDVTPPVVTITSPTDGAVLVKEIRQAVWEEMPTGHVVREGDVKLWLVMVRDSKGLFPGNKNWGEGWGWALFKAEDPAKNASTNYREDCLPCHMDAKPNDWVYVQGYPTLR